MGRNDGVYGSTFIRWRWLTYVSMFIGWSSFMFVRKTLPSSMSSLIQYQGFSRDDIGFIASSFASSYGISKFFVSILSDHFSPRILFSFGLVASGLCCVLFPLAKSVLFASALWFVVGLVQGFGWAPCAVMLKQWYPAHQLGRWWSVLSSAGNIATAISPLFIIYISSLFNWTVSYYFIGLSSLFTGIVVLFSIKSSPADLGIETTFSSPRKDTSKKEDDSDSKESSTNLSWYSVFFIPDLWVVSIVYAAVYAVKEGVLSWAQLYFIQVAIKSQTAAATCVSMSQIGGMLGNLVTGYISDLFVTPRTQNSKCPRAPVLLMASLLLVLMLHLFSTTVNEDSSEVWLSVMAFVIGFLVEGSIAVCGLCAMDVVPKTLAGSAHGLACAVAQVGSFVSGWPFAHIVETHGWSQAYFVLEMSSVVMVVFCSYLTFLLYRGLRKTFKAL